jgi:hypothetical protein
MIKTDYSTKKWNELLKLAKMRQVLKGLKSSELKRENITRLLEKQDAILMGDKKLKSKVSNKVEEVVTDNSEVILNIITSIEKELKLLKTLINK